MLLAKEIRQLTDSRRTNPPVLKGWTVWVYLVRLSGVKSHDKSCSHAFHLRVVLH